MMELHRVLLAAAFSAGRIRTQLIDGERVRTAYVKTPVPEPWVITPTGPAGDEVAVHSDHLYAFDRASYDYWAEQLGVHADDAVARARAAGVLVVQDACPAIEGRARGLG